MCEVLPGFPVVAAVLPNRPPLALTQVGSPLLPGNLANARLFQPLVLGGASGVRHGGPCLLNRWLMVVCVGARQACGRLPLVATAAGCFEPSSDRPSRYEVGAGHHAGGRRRLRSALLSCCPSGPRVLSTPPWPR